jgi:hypothetical protein
MGAIYFAMGKLTNGVPPILFAVYRDGSHDKTRILYVGERGKEKCRLSKVL